MRHSPVGACVFLRMRLKKSGSMHEMPPTTASMGTAGLIVHGGAPKVILLMRTRWRLDRLAANLLILFYWHRFRQVLVRLSPGYEPDDLCNIRKTGLMCFGWASLAFL
jgi:hypothetical protein